jgi:hypothetical protein
MHLERRTLKFKVESWEGEVRSGMGVEMGMGVLVAGELRRANGLAFEN